MTDDEREVAEIKQRLRDGYVGRRLRLRLELAKADVARLLQLLDGAQKANAGFIEAIASGFLVPDMAAARRAAAARRKG